jgi:hypothetical protein
MGSALVVAAVKYGLLALLWVFVVIAFRTVRNDLYAASAPSRPGRGRRRWLRRRGCPPGARGAAEAAQRRAHLVVTEGAWPGRPSAWAACR